MYVYPVAEALALLLAMAVGLPLPRFDLPALPLFPALGGAALAAIGILSAILSRPGASEKKTGHRHVSHISVFRAA